MCCESCLTALPLARVHRASARLERPRSWIVSKTYKQARHVIQRKRDREKERDTEGGREGESERERDEHACRTEQGI